MPRHPQPAGTLEEEAILSRAVELSDDEKTAQRVAAFDDGSTICHYCYQTGHVARDCGIMIKYDARYQDDHVGRLLRARVPGMTRDQLRQYWELMASKHNLAREQGKM